MEAIETNLITGLPEGYTSRPTVPEDAEFVAKILEAEARTIGQTRQYIADEIRDDWKSPNFVLADSSQSVVDSDGTVIGFVTVWDTDKTPVHPHVSFAIHPDHTSKSLGLAMLAWGEERAKQVIDRCPPGSRISMRSGTNDKHEARKAILEAYDMKQIRYFFRMLINLDEAPPKPQLPEGYSIRTATMPDELEAIVQAERDGFKDHWGYVEQPFEDAERQAEKVYWQRGDDESDNLAIANLAFQRHT